MGNENWPHLMRSAQLGNQNDYQLLLEQITPPLRHYLQKRCNFSPDLIEDILQEVLIGIHKARHTYDATHPFEPWMFAIAQYKFIDSLRAFNRQLKNESPADESFFNTYTNIEETSNNPPLIELIHTLSSEQKRVVELLKVKGLSIKETAQLTGKSEANIKVIAHRAYQKLKKTHEKDPS